MRSEYLLSWMTAWKLDILKIIHWNILMKLIFMEYYNLMPIPYLLKFPKSNFIDSERRNHQFFDEKNGWPFQQRCAVDWWYANLIIWFRAPRKIGSNSKQRRRINSRNRLSKCNYKDGDDEVHTSEDAGTLETKTMTGVPVWRKKLGKILEEFQNEIVRMIRIACVLYASVKTKVFLMIVDLKICSWFKKMYMPMKLVY